MLIAWLPLLLFMAPSGREREKESREDTSMSTMASNNSSSSSLIVIENFINGEFLHSEPGSQFESHNPATGEVNALIPDAGPDVVHEAVVAAKQAFQT